MIAIIGALGAVLGIMEFVLPLPMGLMLIYIFQEYRKEVMFSVLSAKLILLLEAILCLNLFYVFLLFVTSVDEIAGVIVFSKASCINNRILILTGTVSALLQNTFTVACLYLSGDTIFSENPIDIWWFTSGVLIFYVILASISYGFLFISTFGIVKNSLDSIRAVIRPYTSKIQELNSLIDYVS